MEEDSDEESDSDDYEESVEDEEDDVTPGALSEEEREDSMRRERVTASGESSRWYLPSAAGSSETSLQDVPRTQVRWEVRRIATKVFNHVVAIWGEGFTSRRRVVGLVQDAFEATNDNYGEAEAIEWAKDFKFPAGIGDSQGCGQIEGSGDP